jgi:rubrerythrin
MTDLYPGKTLAQFFDEAIAFEIQAAEIYTGLSRMFLHSPDIMAVWDKMHNDEIFHAGELRKLKTELTYEQLSAPIGEAMWEKVVSVRQLLSGELLSSINDLSDAYELANQLESSELNAIFQFFLETMPSKERRRLLLSKITEHTGRLYDLGRRFRGKTSMKQISARHIPP